MRCSGGSVPAAAGKAPEGDQPDENDDDSDPHAPEDREQRSDDDEDPAEADPAEASPFSAAISRLPLVAFTGLGTRYTATACVPLDEPFALPPRVLAQQDSAPAGERDREHLAVLAGGVFRGLLADSDHRIRGVPPCADDKRVNDLAGLQTSKPPAILGLGYDLCDRDLAQAALPDFAGVDRSVFPTRRRTSMNDWGGRGCVELGRACAKVLPIGAPRGQQGQPQ